MTFRTYKRHLTAADRRAKETIKACVAGEVGIDYLPDAPRFRYDPTNWSTHSARPTEPRAQHNGPPSGRGSVACGTNPLKLTTWSPTRLDANPMYRQPMKGDSPRLTSARRAWANGDPDPLREYLADLAAEQRQPQQLILEEAA